MSEPFKQSTAVEFELDGEKLCGTVEGLIVERDESRRPGVAWRRVYIVRVADTIKIPGYAYKCVLVPEDWLTKLW